MATGPQHYRKAEELARSAASVDAQKGGDLR